MEQQIVQHENILSFGFISWWVPSITSNMNLESCVRTSKTGRLIKNQSFFSLDVDCVHNIGLATHFFPFEKSLVVQWFEDIKGFLFSTIMFLMQGHLLEHAFDSMLEAGEIPYQSVFKELICQAILQHDYERAISIVKAMAHAPFRVTVKEWTDFFERNGDRINRESLEELLETLSNNDLLMEATVSNLTKSLLFLSRSDKVGDMSRPVAFNGSSVDQSPSAGDNGKLDCGGSRNVQNFSERTGGINGKTHDIHGVGKGNLYISLEDLALDVTSDESAYDCDDELLNHTECGNLDMEEIEIDEPTSLIGNTHESNLPSADEILESWKEGRKSDGIIFPFQFGGK